MIEKLRSEIPDMALRTTLISGFPGETEEDHETLMEFVNEMEFERLGVFAYSAEEDVYKRQAMCCAVCCAGLPATAESLASRASSWQSCLER